MQAAATAAPAQRSRVSTSRKAAIAEADVGESQQPALVSQLQARFDALAVTDTQQHDEHEPTSSDKTGPDAWAPLMLQHEPTLLVLDGDLQAMPWESLPSLQHLRSALYNLLDCWLVCLLVMYNKHDALGASDLILKLKKCFQSSQPCLVRRHAHFHVTHDHAHSATPIIIVLHGIAKPLLAGTAAAAA